MYSKQKLNRKRPAILTMTYGSCENLRSVSVLLHSPKVDAQLNKNQNRDAAEIYLESCVNENTFLKECCNCSDVNLNLRPFG